MKILGVLLSLVAVLATGCTSADFARLAGRRDHVSIVLTPDASGNPVSDIPVEIRGLVSGLPMPGVITLAEGRTDQTGRFDAWVAPHFSYSVIAGEPFGSSSGYVGNRDVKREELASTSTLEIRLQWRKGPHKAPWERAEPGATDNPGDAQ